MITKRFLLIMSVVMQTVVCLCAVEPFTFVHFSDTHIGSEGTEESLKNALADVDKHYPEAAFIVVSGDMTEFGRDYEFTTLTEILKTSKRPVYPSVGNHDVRWSESGKENYRKAFGDTYKMFDHKGIRVMIVDVGMLIEHYGHFDGQQMERLKKDLSTMPEGGAGVMVMHHPPLSAGRYIDNEYQFAELIGQYNVPLVCTGHGHALQRYHFGGTAYCMGGCVYKGGAPGYSYRIYRVEPDKIIPITRLYERDKVTTEDVIALPRKNPAPVSIEQEMKLSDEDRIGIKSLEFTIKVAGEAPRKPCAITVDQITSHNLELTPDGKLNLDVSTLPNGLHQLSVAIADDAGTTSVATQQFRWNKLSRRLTGPATVELQETTPTISREFALKSGCQSHPAVESDVLYVGANDGLLRAIDLASASGTVLWEKPLKSEILSAPAVTSETVIVGSMDSHVYSLDKKTGNEVWKFKTGQAVLASPLVADGVVYIGSGDYNMYALNLKDGKEKWRFPATRLIKATPALKDGKLFFGAWDNFFYCVDAATGKLVWKVPVAHKANGHFSAATSNPVLHEDKIVFCSHDYTVRCLSQETGGTIWTYKPTKEELGPSYSTAVIRDNIAYFGSINGHVVGHSLENGSKVFDVNVRPDKKDDLFDSIPLLKDNKIYIGSVGGNLYCVDIPGQNVSWSVSLQPGFIFTGPAAWKDRILVGSLSDRVFEVNYGAPVVRVRELQQSERP